MSFTYSGSPVPGTTDEIRFLLADINDLDQIFSNEEIQYYIDLMTDVSGSAFRTAANLAEIASAKFAREVTINADGTSIAMEQLQQKYSDLAGRLRALAGQMDASGQGPIVGGSNYDDWFYGGKPKVFGKKMHDNRLAGAQNSYNPALGGYGDYELGGWWEG